MQFLLFSFVFVHLKSLSFDCAAKSVIHAIYGILCITLDVARMHIALQLYCFVDHICILAQTFLAKFGIVWPSFVENNQSELFLLRHPVSLR